MRVRLRVWLRRRRCLTRLSRRRQARAPREAGHRQRFARARHRSSITGIEDTFIRGYRQLPLATLVLVTSGPPVFYRGDRVGRGGRVFTMLKFRTLRADAETRLGPYLGEELVRRTRQEFTPVGRWLKATQLDEIPQFLNVLRGDMSLVGPRPIRPVFFEELAHELPAYWQRLTVRPGLTGLAQVRRGYETSMAEKLAHDLEWIADRSVRLYLRTVFATGWRVLRQSLRGVVSSGD